MRKPYNRILIAYTTEMNTHSTLTGLCGAPVYYSKETDSVMDDAKIHIQNDKPVHGTVIYTDHQKRGRGQYGRVWQSAPYGGLAIAVLLYHDTLPLPHLSSLIAGYAVYRTCAFLCSKNSIDNIAIKWPNDILIAEKKIAGILVERNASWHVVGIGINVLQAPVLAYKSTQPMRAPTHLRMHASAEYFASRSPAECIAHTYTTLQVFLSTLYARSDASVLLAEIEQVLWKRGKRITVHSGKSTYTGILSGLTQDGALRLDGNAHSVQSGHIK